MAEFRKGDVCSLEVVVECVASNGDVLISHPDCQVDEAAAWVTPKHLTLIRRAPVDLATCDLSEPVAVSCPDGRKGWLRARNGNMGFVTSAGLEWAQYPLSELRPADAPAPAAEASPIGWIYFSPDAGTEFSANHPIESGECTDAENIRAATDEVLRDELVQAWRDLKGVERMLAELQDRAADAGEVERLRAALEHVAWSGKFHCFDDASWDIINNTLASTAPSCPPGHLLIGGRAVPEPMREAPEIGEVYWSPLVQVDGEANALICRWRNDYIDRVFLTGGLCHSTEIAARAHAEALLALRKREDV